MEGFAPGFKFDPGDQELINYLLLKKEKEQLLPGRAVVQRDLYGDFSPWEVLNSEGDCLPSQTSKTGDRFIYVLTPLKTASQKRIRRTAGCGKWHQNQLHKISNVNHHDVIGFKRTFVFKVVDNSVFDGGPIKGHWIMHEYTLKNEDFLYALCKITRDDSKHLREPPNNARKRKGAVDEEEEVNESLRKGKQIQAIAEEDEDNQRGGCQESNSTFTVPSRLLPVEGVEQSSSASILQSVPATEPNAKFWDSLYLLSLPDPNHHDIMDELQFLLDS